MSAKPRLVVPEEPDDVLCKVPTFPLLDCREVEAVCTKIEDTFFGGWGQYKWRFWFRVVSPEQYSGMMLEMWVHHKDEWKRTGVPRASKLYKLLPVFGSEAVRGGSLLKSGIVGSAFRCRVHTTKDKDTGAEYSGIDILFERLTG
jgi:hypothetical protein